METKRPGSDVLATGVAFDIVRYSRRERHVQVRLVRGINQVVATIIDRQPPGSVLWASEGDGGHVLFLAEAWQYPALRLVRQLGRWAERAGVTLRVVAHRGQLTVIRGADGRAQPVGDAINTAARVLDVGSEAGIVVSEPFRAAFGHVDGVEFHEERLVRVKHGVQLELWLMSVGPRSRWSDALDVEHRLLREAVAEGRGLDAIFYARRLLQVNSEDPEVACALADLDSIHFGYRSASGLDRLNPILGHLDAANLRRVIDHGELIERGCGEVICRRGDVGNTMFIVLRGQVGVYSDGARPGEPGASRVTMAEGEIVGELAFALNRRRTADVISLGDTALLSFEYQQVSRLLDDGRAMGGGLMREFMKDRALEHVSQNVPYLVGRELSSLSEAGRRTWRGYLNVLRLGSHIIERPPHRSFRLADLRDQDADRAHGGIYVLASGRLRGLTSMLADGPRTKRLDGETYPLLYVDLPHHVVTPDHEYVVEASPARIVFIGLDAIDRLPGDVHVRIVQQLKRSLASMYHYDAFISYNFADLATAERWERALDAAGLTVFRDTPARPGLHYPSRDGQALLDSLTMLVLTSPNAMNAPGENWLLKEVRFREEHFDQQPHIMPVRLHGGDPRALSIMYSSLDAGRHEARAIDEAIRLIKGIRKGAVEPPYGLARHCSVLA